MNTTVRFLVLLAFMVALVNCASYGNPSVKVLRHLKRQQVVGGVDQNKLQLNRRGKSWSDDSKLPWMGICMACTS
ncbi:hypothetical protein L596_015320 [Steinernema carpocapsae]|uniref:Uncharacterized protein n=1 Tax=Steinernema carpocapsae TaxID=34508 RepID=A0A4U5NF78_STECR|nr:hypothetical protein L596_015320 [Steinernema carpocapsae]